MELKKEFGRLPKDMVYDMYTSLVYEFKDYDNITRTKMLDNIIKEYNQENYLYHICTKKELEFLKKFHNKNLKFTDTEKYKWEINELNKKCIFSRITFEVFEEQKENVSKALEYYKKRSLKGEEEIVIFMISVIQINATMLTKVLTNMTSSIFKITEEDVEHLFGHPLFNFYCEFRKEWFDFFNDKEEMISYRKYWDRLDEIKILRQEYGLAGCIETDLRDNYDIFYYGFPIRKEKVKKMYAEVSKLVNSDFIFELIDDVRVLNNRYALSLFINDENLLKIINEALDDIPCAVMNGFTPNQHRKEHEKQKVIETKFTKVSQNNAHLCKNDSDEFYKLYFAILEYTNNKFNISKDIKKIYKQKYLDVNKLYPIDEYLWKNKNIIDEFIKENKYGFTKEELDDIKLFKNSITSNHFIIVGFEKEYTKILSDDGKIYMVKGIKSNLDKLVNPQKLPKVISTTLLMFKNNIIFNSFFSSTDIVFGNDMKEVILKECSSAILYYHL